MPILLAEDRRTVFAMPFETEHRLRGKDVNDPGKSLNVAVH